MLPYSVPLQPLFSFFVNFIPSAVPKQHLCPSLCNLLSQPLSSLWNVMLTGLVIWKCSRWPKVSSSSVLLVAELQTSQTLPLTSEPPLQSQLFNSWWIIKLYSTAVIVYLKCQCWVWKAENYSVCTACIEYLQIYKILKEVKKTNY